MDLFESEENSLFSLDESNNSKPLAVRMRPSCLNDFFGQEHFLGMEGVLRKSIESDQIFSMIFHGPSGIGKTSLARIISQETNSDFSQINAVFAGVKEIREVIKSANRSQSIQRKHILFIDELHRFNKAQQDSLLPFVENGLIILIGATTENPYFAVNKALLSRCQVFQFKLLERSDLQRMLEKALHDKSKGLDIGSCVAFEEDALEYLIEMASGDARIALNTLELAVRFLKKDDIKIKLSYIEQTVQSKQVNYDKNGDQHYDVISAFIKSIRGSDPDASLYWLAKMIHAGEDPRFIFRRMMILASEDVGLADSNAIKVVMSCFQAFDHIGLPEGQYHLAHACLYLSVTAKSNSTKNYFEALKIVEQRSMTNEVPAHLKDYSRSSFPKNEESYKYPHDYSKHWVEQQYLPNHLKYEKFYKPSDEGYEKKIKDWLQFLKQPNSSI